MTQTVHLQWLEIAHRELNVAMHLYETYRPVPFEIICFHCQQSAEKALKALYIFLNIPGGTPRTHDLSLLMDLMHNAVVISDMLFDLADSLTPYAIAARYPSELNFDEYKTKKALQAAKEILNWTEKSMKAQP